MATSLDTTANKQTAAGVSTRDDSRLTQRTPHRAWTLVLASLGVFMTALDTLVVANSLPALRESLHANLGDLEWTVNAYNLAFAVVLADRRRPRRPIRPQADLLAWGCSASLSPRPRRRCHRAWAHCRGPRGSGLGCSRDHADNADPDQRGVPGREARCRHRIVGRHHRAGCGGRTGRRRRHRRWAQLALDLLAQRPDRPGPDSAVDVAPDRELRSTIAARHRRAAAGRRGILRPHLGPYPRQPHRLGQQRDRRCPPRGRRPGRGVRELGTPHHHTDAVSSTVQVPRVQRRQRGQLFHVRVAVRRAVPDDAVSADRAAATRRSRRACGPCRGQAHRC